MQSLTASVWSELRRRECSLARCGVRDLVSHSQSLSSVARRDDHQVVYSSDITPDLIQVDTLSRSGRIQVRAETVI